MCSSRMIRRSFPLALLSVVLAACTGDAPDDAAADDPGPEVVAAAVPDPALFDSIAWPVPNEAVKRGATVYMYSCAKCHGESGAGDARYNLRGRVLQPPSFRTADWQYDDDLPGLRAAIYAGNDRGMPHWGNAGLAARDIDAVARYIMHGLRATID